ncbi:MAG: SH3 domain-containing protein [Lachnospiraceae bacterium]|nr:SH3 domain-containing protein [Lachnospiraceae bacterium]
MRDSKSNIDKTTSSGIPDTDHFLDALAEADDVIAQAIRRKEAEEAIAETDRAVAELAAARKRASQGALASTGSHADSVPDPDGSGMVVRGSTGSKEKEHRTGSTGRNTEKPVPDTGKAEKTAQAHEKTAATAADTETAAKTVPDSEKDVTTASGSGKDAKTAPGSGSRNPGRKGRGSSGRRGHRWLRLLLVLFLCCGTILSVYLIRKYTPTNKRMSFTEYFGQMRSDEAAIVLQDRNLSARALVSDSGSLYVPYRIVRSCLNERFYWDEARSRMLFTTPVQTFEIPINSSSYSVIDGALTSDPTSEAVYKEIVLLRDDTGDRSSGADTPSMRSNSDAEEAFSVEESAANLYVSLQFLTEYTNVTWDYRPESQHVYLRSEWGDTLTSEAVKDAAVRYQGGIKSPILTDLNKGDPVMVLGQTEHWLRVLTADGYIGYVKANRMTAPAQIRIMNEGFTGPEYTSLASDEPVSLIWQMITTKDGNKTFDTATQSMSGITVISPTWFSLLDNDGNVESIGTKAYVKKAHAKGLQVWGLVSDFSPDMDTSAVLASTAARRNCIGQLIDLANTLGLDGINLDLEYMEKADALAYTQFVRELSIGCRLAGLVLSVDLVPPFDFNSYLNRKEIATVCDYLINMGYDEHYAGSAAAGSVASLPYEENAIRNLLAMGISPKKLISAVPFYTRIWYTSTDSDGTTYVNSEELSMGSVAATLDSWHLTPSWDAETAQNYVGWYTDDGVLCQIWIEDAESLQRKLLLIPKYELGGTAVWALGFERDSIWTTVTDTLSKTPEEAKTLEASLIAEKAAQAETAASSSQTETEGGS